ncbi:phytanoyl-CoA dioxygenase family protein [uncultured Brevundimonas sp.]|uniref:phytanoyl-CoA dioxygenase family protein n=1 Tax=uncultured Brevundimonas sp. TaxID=213418 RepID=UPI0030EE2AD0|tara:strand:+ start:158959 stop:159909 length:951 start_codon:yes stop_codon:yes gene_type:complete
MTAQSSSRVDDAGAVTRDLMERGLHVFSPGVDPVAATALLNAVHATRAFGPDLFIDEADFLADPQFRGVNPRPGRNLVDRIEASLDFVERDPAIVAGLSELLGAGYQTLDRKLVCGVPRDWMPDWVRARTEGKAVNNLGPYIRPDYRDITYFAGIDFHQDLIDHPARTADFVTLYIYLHPVTAVDAPLFVLEGSQTLASTLFPHDLTPAGGDAWTYGDGRGGSTTVTQRMLTGDTGYAAVWHACTLHGTQQDTAEHPRLSLRYLLAKASEAGEAGIDAVNRALGGPLSLAATRRDLAEDGSARDTGNIVSTIRPVE